MDNPPVSRTASHLLRQYGVDAAGMAGENLEWSLAHDDADEATFWTDVMAAIRRIEARGEKHSTTDDAVSAVPTFG